MGSTMTTGDAVEYFCRKGRHVVALNFANGKDVGGGYKNGASAQEEDLCRRCPSLYTSLYNAKTKDKLYPYGPCTAKSPTQPGRYTDVLWTPDLVLARGNEEQGFPIWPKDRQVRFSLVSAAAPNLGGKSPDRLDPGLMLQTVKTAFLVSHLFNAQGKSRTLILGAWGCGAFGGDPKLVSETFTFAIKDPQLKNLYDEVHFAIPNFGGTTNGDMFRQVFRKAALDFEEV